MNKSYQNPHILILTEGGHEIGLGHIVRCTALYDEIASRGISVRMIFEGSIMNTDFFEDRTVSNLNWLSSPWIENNVGSSDICIVDSYLVSEELLKMVSQRALMCMFIDDNARISYPSGIVVNPSLSTVNKYSLTNSKITYLIGPSYAILRKPFSISYSKVIRLVVKHVLVTMGGSDIRKLTPIILNALCSQYPSIEFNVMLGQAYENQDFIESIGFSNLMLHKNLDENSMCELMRKSDLAISAAGQTIFELMATQTPFIAIQVIDNQENNIQNLRQYNSELPILHFDDPNIERELIGAFSMMQNQGLRIRLVDQFSQLVDGQGCHRIVDFLLNTSVQEKSYDVTIDFGKYHQTLNEYGVFLRRATDNDKVEVFKLSNEESVREYSINKHRIDWNDHIIWFNNVLNDPNYAFFIVSDYANRFLGQVRYKIYESSATVSISFDSLIRGKGLSKLILVSSIVKIFEEYPSVLSIKAQVSKDNKPSIRLFTGAGFSHTEFSNEHIIFVYKRRNE
jgi:spore coat polysaccharide biosynthesis predicted glycosyltransferase SpsG/RimJ/RimL family protein N-acetyltransferase